MLFMLNIDELVINYINLNDQINKQVIRVVVVFELVNLDTVMIHIVFGLTDRV